MAISDTQKVDLLYKKLFGAAKTDLPGNKGASNEATPSPALVRGDKLWVKSDSIPATAADVPNVVQSYLTTNRIECSADNTTVPVGGVYPSWKTNLTDWIPPEFGATYQVKVYAEASGNADPTGNTALSDAGISGTGEWYFDYQSGVLNFIGGTIPAALNSSKVIYITGYRYIGAIGTTSLTNLTTANIAENAASGNLYYTNARVLSNVEQMSINVFADVDITGIQTNGSLVWNGTAFVAGTASNAANANTAVFANATTFANTAIFSQTANIANTVSTISNFSTSNLAEGNNLYYTNSRVLSYVSPLLALKANVVDLTTSNVVELNNLYYTNARVYSNIIQALPTYSGELTSGNLVIGSGGSITGANLVSAVNFSAANWLNLYTANVIEYTNLYYTNARVLSNVEQMSINVFADVDITGIQTNGSLVWNGTSFVAGTASSASTANVSNSVLTLNNFTTSNLAEGTNLYYTNARVNAQVESNLALKANVVDLTTANVIELDNLYYSNDRVYSNVVSLLPDYAGNITASAITVGSGGSLTGANLISATNIQADNWLNLYTSNVIESDNLYYTNARVLSNVEQMSINVFADVDISGIVNNGTLIWNGTSFVAGVTSSAGSANTALFAETANTANTAIFAENSNTANTVASISNFTTTDLAEGNNLYYTNARVDAQIQPSVAELRALVSRFNSNVLYVATNGNDANDGTTFGNAFANIHVALAHAQPWTTIFLKSGDYKLHNQPVTIPGRVALVGDNLRTTTIRPTQPAVDMFYVNNACYVTGITFRDHVSPAAVFSFNPDGSAGTIVTSPYIQNCSSITTSGTGMRVDGRYVSGLRSMVCDAYTQTNEGGIGIHMLHKGYTQLVSVFTICCHIAIKCESGGFCSITNSNASFGTYGLWADGVSEPLYYGKVQSGTTEATNQISISNLNIRPNYGDAVLFANYNQDKCYRDAGLIVDSLAFDLAYGSNTQATFAGLQYWAQPSSAIPNQSPETLNAINVAAQIAVQLAAGTSVSQVYQSNVSPSNGTGGTAVESGIIQNNFNTITGIIQNGTVGVTDTIIPNQYPANTNINVSNAANLIIANKSFIAAEVIGYIDSTYPGFWANTTFLDSANALAKCSRDVGYILESVTFDLRHGGNRQSVTSGTYYYQYDANDTQINDQVVQTGAAYYFIGGLVDKIVRGNVIANVYQNSVTQNTTAASYATSSEANIILNDIVLLANIVSNGPSVAPAKQPITYTPSGNTNIINATKLVLANRDFIKAEVLEFVNQNWANISNGASTFYTVKSATELVANTSTVTLLETVTNNILANSRVSFHQGSYISSSGHTFEYVGSGDQIATALPYLGGVPKQENEVIELRGGKVYFTSTDQLGDFRIGKGLVINRVDGTITGRTFNKALFAVMTPYMLAIEG